MYQIMCPHKIFINRLLTWINIPLGMYMTSSSVLFYDTRSSTIESVELIQY